MKCHAFRGLDPNCQIIIGGDLNSHLDSSLDNLGGKIKSKPSVKKINETRTANHHMDIWGIWKKNWKKAIYLNAEKTLNKTKSELSAR